MLMPVIAAMLFIHVQALNVATEPPPPPPPTPGDDPTGWRDRYEQRRFQIQVPEGVVVTKLLARSAGTNTWGELEAGPGRDGWYNAQVPEIMVNEDEMVCDFDLLLVLNDGARRIERRAVNVCSLGAWLIGVDSDKMTCEYKAY